MRTGRGLPSCWCFHQQAFQSQCSRQLKTRCPYDSDICCLLVKTPTGGSIPRDRNGRLVVIRMRLLSLVNEPVEPVGEPVEPCRSINSSITNPQLHKKTYASCSISPQRLFFIPYPLNQRINLLVVLVRFKQRLYCLYKRLLVGINNSNTSFFHRLQ
jgi:hypothetical protein